MISAKLSQRNTGSNFQAVAVETSEGAVSGTQLSVQVNFVNRNEYLGESDKAVSPFHGQIRPGYDFTADSSNGF